MRTRRKLGSKSSHRGEVQANAQACQADYIRQHPGSAEAAKPAWFNAGLFSGVGELALPGAALVDHKERQEDGSFLVFVWLSHEYYAAPNSSPTGSTWRNWHVSALVKSEEGKYVVDNVRLFGDDSIDSPSRLLSDSFAGCDGAHWTGLAAMNK